MGVTNRYIGQSIPRKEDRRLLTGRGRFIADVALPRMLQVAFVRSPIAHGVLRGIDTSKASAMPGVAGVFTAHDLRALKAVPGMQNKPPAIWRERVPHEIAIPDQPLVAVDRVRYVGEPIAIVVAEDRYLAEDAVEQIEADIDPLPVCASVESALVPGAPTLHAGAPGNVVARFAVAKGDVAAAAKAGAHRIRRRFVNHRFLAMPLECRGVAAEYDHGRDTVTIWSSTQVVHWVRREVAKQLGLREERVRCVAPDVGGGFGVKGHVYPEDIMIPWLARELGRPVAWIEDRHEHLLHSTHSRDDVHDAELVLDADGRILALADDFLKDSGAFTPVGIGSPSNSTSHIASQYHVPNMRLAPTIVATNKAPNAPYRGAGRPEATFVMERLLDLAAREIGLDPVELRRRNLIGPERMPYDVGLPYRDGATIVYDSGDYPRVFEQAIDAIGGLEAFRARQREARAADRYIGLGVACYVEGSGAGPFEGATIRIEPSGGVYVATGACSQGQSHETVFAQVAADEWGVRPEDVTIVVSDSAAIAHGYGTIASRSGVNSSAAIRMASATLRAKVFAIASDMLECDAADLELIDGHVRLKGVPDHKVSLREIARIATPGVPGRPAGIASGLEATEYFEPPTVTWAYGTHAAVVEVDVATGEPRILQYVVAHDAGVILNPMVADGQVVGGVVQGIGGCMLERVVYDENGQNLSASLADYRVPVAAGLPRIDVLHTETPSTLNELGVKGLGEGGVVGPPAAIVNAVCDALAPFGFEWNESHLDPAAIALACARSRAAGEGGSAG